MTEAQPIHLSNIYSKIAVRDEAVRCLSYPATGRWPKDPAQRPVTRSFEVFRDLRLNKLMSKQSRRRWLETPSRAFWRHCNDYENPTVVMHWRNYYDTIVRLKCKLGSIHWPFSWCECSVWSGRQHIPGKFVICLILNKTKCWLNHHIIVSVVWTRWRLLVGQFFETLQI